MSITLSLWLVVTLGTIGVWALVARLIGSGQGDWDFITPLLHLFNVVVCALGGVIVYLLVSR